MIRATGLKVANVLTSHIWKSTIAGFLTFTFLLLTSGRPLSRSRLKVHEQPVIRVREETARGNGAGPTHERRERQKPESAGRRLSRHLAKHTVPEDTEDRHADCDQRELQVEDRVGQR